MIFKYTPGESKEDPEGEDNGLVSARRPPIYISMSIYISMPIYISISIYISMSIYNPGGKTTVCLSLSC